MNFSVKGRDFGLKKERDCIVGKKQKDRYMEYQDQYRSSFGVFPELDIKNNPFSANWNDVYETYCGFRRRGFYGAWFYHDIHASFNKRLGKLYEKYKKEWSFLISIDYKYRSLLSDIPQMKEQECITNDLGYRKDADGNYYEGTWSNDKFVYGLIYFSSYNTFFVGKMNDDINSTFSGVCARIDTEKKNNLIITTMIGTFFLKGEYIEAYTSDYLLNTVKVREGSWVTMESSIGEYRNGYEEGRCITKYFSEDDIKISLERYKDGEVKGGIGIWGYIWRIYIALSLIACYYIIKFSYGLPFYLIYRIYKKKNWK